MDNMAQDTKRSNKIQVIDNVGLYLKALMIYYYQEPIG